MAFDFVHALCSKLDRIRLRELIFFAIRALTRVVPAVDSHFGTSPEPWNYLLKGMTLLPDSIMGNRDLMQALAEFSEPLVRITDKLVRRPGRWSLRCEEHSRGEVAGCSRCSNLIALHWCQRLQETNLLALVGSPDGDV